MWSGRDSPCVLRPHNLTVRRCVTPTCSHTNANRYPTTCLFSPQLLPKPHDWPAHVNVSGFLSLADALTRYDATTASITTNSSACSSSGSDVDSSSNCRDDTSLVHSNSYQPPADLQTFLDAGPPPIYIGFGSTVVEDPQALMQTVMQAVQLLQDTLCNICGDGDDGSTGSGGMRKRVRVLVCTGWSGGAQAAAVAAAAQQLQQQGGSGGPVCDALDGQQQQQQGGVKQGDGSLQAVNHQDSASSGAAGAASGGAQRQTHHQPLAGLAAGSSSAQQAAPQRQQTAVPDVHFTSEVPHEWLFPRCVINL